MTTDQPIPNIATEPDAQGRVLKFRVALKCKEHVDISFRYFTIDRDKWVSGNWVVKCGPHSIHHYERLFSPIGHAQQLTPFTDMANKEIWEGDLCEIGDPGHEVTVEIIFKDGAFGHVWPSLDKFTPMFNYPTEIFGINGYRVIGNIHERLGLV